jgi:hypothetical protein
MNSTAHRFLWMLLLGLAGVTLVSRTVTAGDSDGCDREVNKDPSTGEWYHPCNNATCGASENLPCTIITGGAPGANFTYCGCQDDSPQTPICCYTTIDQTTGVPSKNGYCYGQTPAATAALCNRPPCRLTTVTGTQKKAFCTGLPPLPR